VLAAVVREVAVVVTSRAHAEYCHCSGNLLDARPRNALHFMSTRHSPAVGGTHRFHLGPGDLRTATFSGRNQTLRKPRLRETATGLIVIEIRARTDPSPRVPPQHRARDRARCRRPA
jgi:hypothetical protein